MTEKDPLFRDSAPEESDSDNEIESSELVDEDICDLQEIERLFFKKFTPFSEECISPEKEYILSLSSNKSFSKISTGLSSGFVQIFTLDNGLVKSNEILPKDSVSLSGTKFLDENELFVGRTNGKIEFHDLRTPGCQHIYESTEDVNCNSCTTIDVNSNSRILCAGTEQESANVYLLFFDIRQRKFLGGYSESHQDDVTEVKFHPSKPDLLITGSTDGLINVFDIGKTTEDDALLSTINTENSVEKLNWHKNVYEKDIISCITHTNELKIYEADEGDLMSEFSRTEITTAMKRKVESECNLINCHNLDDNSPFLLASSNYNKGEILRSLKIQNKSLLPYGNFEDNKQIVRVSLFNTKEGLLITGGESSIVTLWSTRERQNTILKNSPTRLKMKAKSELAKVHRKKPY